MKASGKCAAVRKEFLYSRLMCWVAIDRGVRLAPKLTSTAPREAWVKTHKMPSMRRFSTDSGVRGKERPSCRHKSSTTVDAQPAAHAAGEIHFTDRPALALDDARHRTRAGGRLARSPLSHRRRRARWAAPAPRGYHFSMCTFWYAECLARAGDPLQGRFIFEKMLGYANHVGLYAEEIGPEGEHLGNFPQAFTHLGLISAAYALDRRLSVAGHAG